MGLRDNPVVNLWRYQWKYSKGRRGYILAFSILFVIANVIQLFEPYVLGKVFTIIQLETNNPDFLSILFTWIGLLLFTSLGFWAFHGPARVIEKYNGFKVGRDYQMDLLNKVMALDASWHRDHHSGDTIDKCNRATTALLEFSQRNFVVFETVLRSGGPIVALLILDMRAALVAIIVTIITIGGLTKFDKALVKRYKKLYKMYNYTAAGVHDYLSNIVTVITLRLHNTVSKEITCRLNRPFELFKKNVKLDQVKWAFANFMIQTMIVVVLGWITYDAYKLEGLIIVGTIYTLYGYLRRLGMTFYNFAFRYGIIVEDNAKVKSAEVLFDAYDAMPDQTVRHLPRKWKHIAIRDLNFSYGIAKKKGHHLDGINLDLMRGKNIAFVGKSGSGKSTMMALIRGLYKAKNVIVSVDGKELEYGFAHMYEHTALIPQDPEIFNATIERNITMGLQFPKKTIKKVIEQARFASVVKRLKKGLDTNVMEKGVSLSGGEKQRLALARGLLAGQNSDILLMDEPTSSVDSPNEIAIYKRILKTYKHKTIISSIHRLHLLHMFDYIYLFGDGNIIAEGTFAQMLKNKHFKPIWKQYTQKNK